MTLIQLPLDVSLADTASHKTDLLSVHNAEHIVVRCPSGSDPDLRLVEAHGHILGCLPRPIAHRVSAACLGDLFGSIVVVEVSPLPYVRVRLTSAATQQL